MLVLLVLFQFTPLREGLPIEAFFSLHGMYFNSRPCERGFEKKQNPFKESVISIHAPARGASLVNQGVEEDYLFQFTPLREGLQQKSTIFLSVFCCFLFIKYIFQKLILSNSKFNQYRPYICAIFIAPIS